MKKFALFILATLIISSSEISFAQNNSITWYSFEQAIAMNKTAKKKKKIFIDIYTSWCGWCKKMDQSTFADSAVVAIMDEYFIAVKLNAEQADTIFYNGYAYVNPSPYTPRSSHQLAQALLQGQMSYPSYVYMNESEGVIGTVKGFRNASEFANILRYYGMDIYLKKSWVEFIQSQTN